MNTKYATPDHRQADAMLYEIASARRDLDVMTADLVREMDVVKARYSDGIALLERTLAEKERELAVLQKRRRDVLFDGTDKVALSHGVLIRKVEAWVVHARGVLGKLEALGRTEAVKISKSVDWDHLKKWSDEELSEAGTRRERRETFAYELSGK